MLICFDNPIINLQFLFALFLGLFRTYRITNEEELFEELDGINENISALQSDIDADSGTDDDKYNNPEPNQVNPNPSNGDR